MNLWGDRQTDTNVTRRIELPASMRSWVSDTTFATGPVDATIQAITGGANYHTDALHLNATGIAAVRDAGIPQAVNICLAAGGLRSRTLSRNYR